LHSLGEAQRFDAFKNIVRRTALCLLCALLVHESHCLLPADPLPLSGDSCLFSLLRYLFDPRCRHPLRCRRSQPTSDERVHVPWNSSFCSDSCFVSVLRRRRQPKKRKSLAGCRRDTARSFAQFRFRARCCLSSSSIDEPYVRRQRSGSLKVSAFPPQPWIARPGE
jgi:hypothetical protein